MTVIESIHTQTSHQVKLRTFTLCDTAYKRIIQSCDWAAIFAARPLKLEANRQIRNQIISRLTISTRNQTYNDGRGRRGRTFINATMYF